MNTIEIILVVGGCGLFFLSSIMFLIVCWCRSNNESKKAYCQKCKHTHGDTCWNYIACRQCGHTEASNFGQCRHVISTTKRRKDVEHDEPYTEYYSEDETIPTSYTTQEIEVDEDEAYEDTECIQTRRPVEHIRDVPYTDYDSQYVVDVGSDFGHYVTNQVTRYRPEYYTEYVYETTTRPVTKHRTKRVTKTIQVPENYVKRHVKKSRTAHRKVIRNELVDEPKYCDCKSHKIGRAHV